MFSPHLNPLGKSSEIFHKCTVYEICRQFLCSAAFEKWGKINVEMKLRLIYHHPHLLVSSLLPNEAACLAFHSTILTPTPPSLFLFVSSALPLIPAGHVWPSSRHPPDRTLRLAAGCLSAQGKTRRDNTTRPRSLSLPLTHTHTETVNRSYLQRSLFRSMSGAL